MDMWKKLLKKENLILIVFMGILLFVINLPVKDTRGRTGTSLMQTGQTQNDCADSQSGDYEGQLEKRLEEALGRMEGVGAVKVMVTLKTSEEKVLQDGKGFDNRDCVVQTVYPKVEGVFVLAEGAGNGRIRCAIVQIIESLLGVESHKIQVEKMSTN